MYAVRSKAGRVVQRFATRAAAERFVRGSAARSPERLTPDVLPYSGYGIQTAGEAKATIAFLRAVLAAEERRAAPSYALDAPIGSNEYMGAVAALRGGLVQQSGHDRTGPLRLTPLGREYLAQRQSAKSPTRGFLPGHKRSTERLSIDGWKIRYNEPTYGTREFVVTTRHELAKAKEWLDAGGHSYRVSPFLQSSPWKKEGLADLMRQGFMRPRAARKATPWTLTPKDNERGYGLLYDISCNGRAGMIGRSTGGGSDYYVIENGDITSRGHRTVQQAAKAFAKGSRS